MRLRNGEAGYGLVTKTLHWLTVGLLLAQLVVGYVLAGSDDSSGHGRGRGRGGGEDDGHGRGRGRGGDDLDLDSPLLRVHLVVGLTLLLVALVRVAWRRLGGLPPWASSLSDAQRRLATWTERALLTALVLMPLSGLAVLLGDDDLLVLHVASHLLLYAALLVHVGLVLRARLLPRMT